VVRWIDHGAIQTTLILDGSTATCPHVCGTETARWEMEHTTGVPSVPPDTVETAKTGTLISPILMDGTAPHMLTGELEMIIIVGTLVERGRRGVTRQIYSTGGRYAGSLPVTRTPTHTTTRG